MNILGLLMAGLLNQTMSLENNARRAGGMKGDVFVKAGGMGVSLRFDGQGIIIMKGPTKRPRARVGGAMEDLLSMVTGGGLVGPVLSGKVRIGGNPFFLLKMLPLIQAS
ncbi:MAG: hypothetical protein ISR64_10955 [Deltaproteobacteria bacterium]|nr:hypothetical protein [Deltaproteobacteria bacterium]